MAKFQCTECGHVVSGTNPPPNGGSGTPCKGGNKNHIWNRLSRFIQSFSDLF